jgi:ribosomal-protein-alanine N-acetyltransferase
MNYQVDGIILRRPEPADLDALYAQKNDPEIAGLLGGFTTGYSRQDLKEWLEYHRQRQDEVLWAIVRPEDNACIGHVGLYQIDNRVRAAELAILIGDSTAWGKGVGRNCTKFVVEYGFCELNLNRIHLSVLSTNERAIRLYRGLGFREEGRLRQAQYKRGQYLDVLLMALLREEYDASYPI